MLVERHGRLEVDFDRPLREAHGDATGINQFTFRVQFGGAERNLEFVPSDEGPVLIDRTRAVFTIDPDLWDRNHRPLGQAGHLAARPARTVRPGHLAV